VIPVTVPTSRDRDFAAERSRAEQNRVARRAKKLAETLERFDTELVPGMLIKIATLAEAPATPPAVCVQLLQAGDRLRALLPATVKTPGGMTASEIYQRAEQEHKFLVRKYGEGGAREHFERKFLERLSRLARALGLPEDSPPNMVEGAAVRKLAGVLDLPLDSGLEACRVGIVENQPPPYDYWPKMNSEPTNALFYDTKLVEVMSIIFRQPERRTLDQPDRKQVVPLAPAPPAELEPPAEKNASAASGIIPKSDWSLGDPYAPWNRSRRQDF